MGQGRQLEKHLDFGNFKQPRKNELSKDCLHHVHIGICVLRNSSIFCKECYKLLKIIELGGRSLIEFWRLPWPLWRIEAHFCVSLSNQKECSACSWRILNLSGCLKRPCLVAWNLIRGCLGGGAPGTRGQGNDWSLHFCRPAFKSFSYWALELPMCWDLERKEKKSKHPGDIMQFWAAVKSRRLAFFHKNALEV